MTDKTDKTDGLGKEGAQARKLIKSIFVEGRVVGRPSDAPVGWWMWRPDYGGKLKYVVSEPVDPGGGVVGVQGAEDAEDETPDGEGREIVEARGTGRGV